MDEGLDVVDVGPEGILAMGGIEVEFEVVLLEDEGIGGVDSV